MQTMNFLDFFILYSSNQHLYSFCVTFFLSNLDKNLFEAFADQNIFNQIFFFENFSQGLVNVSPLLFYVVNCNEFFRIDGFDVKHFFLKIIMKELRAGKLRHVGFQYRRKSMICWGLFFRWTTL